MPPEKTQKILFVGIHAGFQRAIEASLRHGGMNPLVETAFDLGAATSALRNPSPPQVVILNPKGLRRYDERVEQETAKWLRWAKDNGAPVVLTSTEMEKTAQTLGMPYADMGTERVDLYLEKLTEIARQVAKRTPLPITRSPEP